MFLRVARAGKQLCFQYLQIIDCRMGVTPDKNIQNGINTLGDLACIKIGHGMILQIKSNEFNDAKNNDKREAKKNQTEMQNVESINIINC
ncbi:hypothetical protein HMPREF0880_03270 [Yokenella regensburgei ATCC 43003]|nr:hypothetical protein HMPREF0880_03270 [Yokenella regensburgei ATCC 43003]